MAIEQSLEPWIQMKTMRNNLLFSVLVASIAVQNAQYTHAQQTDQEIVSLAGTALTLTQSQTEGRSAATQSYGLFEDKLRTVEGLRSQLDVLARQRKAVESEFVYIKSKVEWARRKQEGQGAKDDTEESYRVERDRWMREVKAWDARLARAKEQVQELKSEEEHLLSALKEATRGGGGGAKDVVIPSETLEVIVTEDDTLNGLYQVRRGGYIIMPRVGRVLVAGRTLLEVEKAVKDELEATQLRRATVMVERAAGMTSATANSLDGGNVIYLSGEVSMPGPWPIPRGFRPTIVTTLLRAGGLRDSADLEHIRVLRLVQGRALVEEVNVKEIMEGGGLTADYTLQPEDIVIVPAIGISKIVHLTGLVNNPGLVRLTAEESATLATTLLKAGGFADGADPANVRVMRLVKGQAVVHEINVAEIMEGGKPIADFQLEAGDIITVPQKGLPKRVFLTGSIAKPGFIELRPGENATVYATVVRAGGFARFASLKKTYVLRDMGDGLRTRIPVDVKSVKKGILPDLILEDNDIVVVPEKFFSF